MTFKIESVVLLHLYYEVVSFGPPLCLELSSIVFRFGCFLMVFCSLVKTTKLGEGRMSHRRCHRTVDVSSQNPFWSDLSLYDVGTQGTGWVPRGSPLPTRGMLVLVVEVPCVPRGHPWFRGVAGLDECTRTLGGGRKGWGLSRFGAHIELYPSLPK